MFGHKREEAETG